MNFFEDQEKKFLSFPGCSAIQMSVAPFLHLLVESSTAAGEGTPGLALLAVWGKAGSACCLRQGWQFSMMLRGERSTGHKLWPDHGWDLLVLENPKQKVCVLLRTSLRIRIVGLKLSISTNEQEATLVLSPVAFLVIFHALNKNIKLCDF